MKKNRITLFSGLLLILAACQPKTPAASGIVYPNKPYKDDDHIMLKDPYAFYNIAGNNTNYWGSANTHDPSIIKEGDFYYAFSTDANMGVLSQKGIHIRKSADLVKWDFVTTALDLTTVTSQFEYIGYNETGVRIESFWAPDIIKRGDEFWLYYSLSSSGQRTSTMGLAKAKNITGPYIFDREILRTHQVVGGTPNAIDPAILVENVNGVEKMWMTYGSWSAGIFVTELDPKTGYLLTPQSLVEAQVSLYTSTPGVRETVTRLVPANSNDPAFGTRILSITTSEAPYVMKENGYYYLFITNGVDLTYDYDARVFRSKNITGPYVDAKGKAALSATSNQTFRGYGNKVTIAHQFNYLEDDILYKRGYSGLGHSTAFHDNDEWFFASHYRGTFMDRHRFFLGIWKMHFVNDWPVIEPNRYTGPGSVDLEVADISGPYRIQIVHQGAVNSTLTGDIISIVKRAEEITLTNQKDGEWRKVTGDYEGRYRLHNGLLELDLGNSVYKGYISAQFNYELGHGVLGLSLLNNDGTALWGNRYILEGK